MLLSQTAEYALRAMAFLVNAQEGTRATARDVSQATSIPEPYAAKVLRKMVLDGLLIGQKGHGGGFQLARSAESIRIGDVLQAVDEELISDRCAFGREKCNALMPCPLHDTVSKLKEHVRHWARSTTLATLRGKELPAQSALWGDVANTLRDSTDL
jgi:Rrf2 family protein